jgi:DNA-binding transcriptional ArsR family regulator
MPVLSEKTRAKTTEMRHAFPDETRLDILDHLKGGELRV